MVNYTAVTTHNYWHAISPFKVCQILQIFVMKCMQIYIFCGLSCIVKDDTEFDCFPELMRKISYSSK